MHFNQFDDQIPCDGSECQIFQKWREQSDFHFGFIPLGEQLMPSILQTNAAKTGSLIEVHEIVKNMKKPNFLQARIPVISQLKVEMWRDLLKYYWDQQLF